LSHGQETQRPDDAAGLTRAQSRAYDAAIKQDAEREAVRQGDPDALLRAARKGAAVARIAAKAPAPQRTTIGYARKGFRSR
jgi:hypothetical protein